MLNPADEASLRDLSSHWEGAYTFAVVDDTWTATPAGEPTAVMMAESAFELRELVRRDYAARQSVISSDIHERMST